MYLFIIRAILSVIFACFASRVFLGNTGWTNVLLLAAVLLGLAYLFEYMRKKEGDGKDNG